MLNCTTYLAQLKTRSVDQFAYFFILDVVRQYATPLKEDLAFDIIKVHHKKSKDW